MCSWAANHSLLFSFPLLLIPLVVHVLCLSLPWFSCFSFSPALSLWVCAFGEFRFTGKSLSLRGKHPSSSFQTETDVKVGQAYLWACELSLLQYVCICVHPRESPKINASSFIHVSTFRRTEQHPPPSLFHFCLLFSFAFLSVSSERKTEKMSEESREREHQEEEKIRVADAPFCPKIWVLNTVSPTEPSSFIC